MSVVSFSQWLRKAARISVSSMSSLAPRTIASIPVPSGTVSLQPKASTANGPMFRVNRFSIGGMTPRRTVQTLDDDELDKLGLRSQARQLGGAEVIIDGLRARHDFHSLR